MPQSFPTPTTILTTADQSDTESTKRCEVSEQTANPQLIHQPSC